MANITEHERKELNHLIAALKKAAEDEVYEIDRDYDEMVGTARVLSDGTHQVLLRINLTPIDE